MGLEKLKSVFKEGWGFPGPVDGWSNTHAEGFTLDLEEGNKTQFKIPSVYPILNDIQRGSSYQFVTEDLTKKLYDDENFDPRPGRPRGPISNINIYKGTRFDDGVGGLFNQTERYYGGFGNINTPKFEDIINSGNVTANSSGYPNLTGLLERYENINPQNESRPKPESYLKDGKINTNRTWTQSSIPQFNDLYSTEGGQEKRTITIDLANDLKAKTLEGTSWETLYNPEHTAKEGVGYSYPNVSRDNLNLRYSSGGGVFGDPRTQGFGFGAGEPYIISDIPTGEGLKGGRLINFASRNFPILRAATDTLRLTKYLTSPAGLAFIAKQNLLGLNSKIETPLLSLRGEQPPTLVSPQRFGTFYNPLSALGAAGSRLLGTTPNILFRRDELLPGLFVATSYSQTVFKLDNTFGGYSELGRNPLTSGIIDGSTSFPIAAGVKFKNPIKRVGDKMTLAKMKLGDSIISAGPDTWAIGKETENKFVTNFGVNIESNKSGMPFYFKDLRDDTYVLFRAFVESLTENISPSWSTTNYIGRSEPVYVYERSERDVSFTLKLFAHTADELESIYQKMNRLTSMCYPSYVKDINLNGKLRMKPPLLKFRLGELFGSRNNEMLGFLKSCAYSYPDTSPWSTEQGKRVPKHITVSLTYQVIHMEVPSLDFAREKDGGGNKNKHTFYGITSPKNVGQGI